MYNRTILFMRKRWNNHEKTTTSFKTIRTYFLKEEKDKIRKYYNAPSHMLDGAIKLACASYKSAFTNFRNGNIKHFRIRYLKENKDSHILDIEKTSFNEKTFYKTILGNEMKNNEDYNYKNIEKDSKLHYNVKTKKFTLLVPIEDEIINNKPNNDYISIDPGVRTFLTCLTNNNVIEICQENNKKI